MLRHIARFIAGLLASVLALGLAPAASAETVSDTTTLPCVLSGTSATGPEADRFCWVDWSGFDFNDSEAYSDQGRQVRFSMPGGRIEATLRFVPTDPATRLTSYRPAASEYKNDEARLWSAYGLPESIVFPAVWSGEVRISLTGMRSVSAADNVSLKDWEMAFGDSEIMSFNEKTVIKSDKPIRELGLIGDQNPGHSYTTTHTLVNDSSGGTLTLAGGWSGYPYGGSAAAAVASSRMPSSFDVDMTTVYSARSSIAIGFHLPYAVLRKLVYDSNDGNGSMDSRNQESGSTVTVADNGFTRDGYTFTGWNTSPNGTGTDYKPGDALTVTADTTLYAQWKRVPETTLPDTGGHANHAPLIVGGGVTAAALALAVVARRRGGRHAV
ncbi:InlB B-repeat-containing protein [Bifidobacterium adolescentis]|uniref:InlB B-repeat-containing protein n=1 Tax=Bifidobacterium adolescentis TaxID=1680 RepID=UPI0018DC863F|nr:InlB B-repeat-containing protein [Bifidobacterium adolescentis]MBH8621561.1 InlB B-repeat-containing protein [Bifidobacterium adolescentis]